MHALLRRGLFAAAAIALLATLAVSSPDLRFRRVQPSALPTDELLVYQNGFCQVFRTLDIVVKDGEAILDLPAGTIVDTLRIQGLEIIEILARDATRPFLPGDHVVILVGSDPMEGRILAIGERFVIETDNGTRYLDPASVRAVTILDATQPVPGQMQVRVRVTDADGPHRITIDYLLRGLSWHASHEIDVGTGEMRTWATITGSPGLEVEHLKLISGAPRLVLTQPTGTLRFAGASFGAAADRSEHGWTPASLDEYHEYDLGRPIELPAGRDLRLGLFTNHVDLFHELVANASPFSGALTVEHRWTFTNPSREPLPSGPVAFYRDGRFIGQDPMAYLPRAEKTTLVSGDALDVKASVSVDCIEADREHLEVSVTNRKTDRATVRVEVSIPHGWHVESPAPDPVRSKGMIAWTFSLEPDATAMATARLTETGTNPCPVVDS